MLTLQEIQKKLRRNNWKNYQLYIVCNMISLMLITSYSAMMTSKTVLEIFPEGGDSRKQMFMIFELTCVGCGVFTVYAGSLFFRMKAKEIGIFMALGASKKRLTPMILSETIVISTSSAFVGILCGIPFAWMIWKLFQVFVVDTKEMQLRWNFEFLLISAVFFLVVVLVSIFTGLYYLKRTNIMEVIQEEHRNEPVKTVGMWCGLLGVILLVLGGILGYFAPNVYMKLMQAYPPAILNLFYLPALIGVYLVLLHTIVHGWFRKKNPYHGMISRSIMKFQGKQTINNMIVVTVLIAGGCFGIFYLPTVVVGQIISNNNREFDYGMEYPADQKGVLREEIEKLARSYGVVPIEWKESFYISLALDGNREVKEGRKFHYEYEEMNREGNFISSSQYKTLTGTDYKLKKGEYMAISNTEETGTYYVTTMASCLTNPLTSQQVSVTCKGYAHNEMLNATRNGFYILNDEDYAILKEGLTEEWTGKIIWFNVKNDTIAFADTLFNRYVDSFDSRCEVGIYYDRIEKKKYEERGEEYLYGQDVDEIHYDERNSSDFRMYWKYMPQFRLLDQNSFLMTVGVFLMMFLFVAIVCLIGTFIICYTRCMTLVVNNQYIFDDLKKLGASRSFLWGEVRQQARKVFFTPAIVGMSMIYFLYCMILYANDGKLAGQEFFALLACFGVLLVILFILSVVYKISVRSMIKKLE